MIIGRLYAKLPRFKRFFSTQINFNEQINEKIKNSVKYLPKARHSISKNILLLFFEKINSSDKNLFRLLIENPNLWSSFNDSLNSYFNEFTKQKDLSQLVKIQIDQAKNAYDVLTLISLSKQQNESRNDIELFSELIRSFAKFSLTNQKEIKLPFMDNLLKAYMKIIKHELATRGHIEDTIISEFQAYFELYKSKIPNNENIDKIQVDFRHNLLSIMCFLPKYCQESFNYYFNLDLNQTWLSAMYFENILIAAIQQKNENLIEKVIDKVSNWTENPDKVSYTFRNEFNQMFFNVFSDLSSLDCLLNSWSKTLYIPNNKTIEGLKNFLKKFNDPSSVRVFDTQIDSNGYCENTQLSMDKFELTQEQFTILSEYVKESLIFGGVYSKELNSNDFYRFEEYMRHRRFDVIIDGLNVCSNFSGNKLDKTLKLLRKYYNKKRILIIIRNHAKRYISFSMYEKIYNISFFAVSNDTTDDQFYIYGALKSGPGTMIATNDYLRDHISHLKGYNLLFRRWLQSVKIEFNLVKPPFDVCMPRPYEIKVNRSGNYWFIPYYEETEETKLQQRNLSSGSLLKYKWICIEKLK